MTCDGDDTFWWQVTRTSQIHAFHECGESLKRFHIIPLKTSCYKTPSISPPAGQLLDLGGPQQQISHLTWTLCCYVGYYSVTGWAETNLDRGRPWPQLHTHQDSESWFMVLQKDRKPLAPFRTVVWGNCNRQDVREGQVEVNIMVWCPRQRFKAEHRHLVTKL